MQPFEDDNVGKLLEKIVAADFEIPKNASKNLKDLLMKILNPNAKKRIQIEEIIIHPFFLESPKKKNYLF